MKTISIVISLILGLLLAGGIIVGRQAQPKREAQKTSETQEAPSTTVPLDMKLISSAFANNQSIPPKYTCDGENVNPPLSITEVPDDAKSLVLIVDDPDAPRGDWVHWLVWNIPPSTKEIAERLVPDGAIQGLTDFGENKYGGPCPPSGTHRYQFTLYALNTTLTLPSQTKKPALENAMKNHILSQTLLVGLYQRL